MKQVSAVVDDLIYQKIKQNRWTFAQVINKGVESLEGNLAMNLRICELEEGNKKLHSKITRLYEALEAAKNEMR